MPARRRPVLEVIVSTVGDARAAWEGGADRAEVVSRLDEDGLTPSREVVEAMLAAVPLPLRVMVRPADVFTVTDRTARAAILADARRWVDLPLHGVVTGYVTPEGEIDEALLRGVADASGHRVTFHRAIERVTAGDAMGTLRRVTAVDRILSGGGAGAWEVRLAQLEQLQVRAAPLVVVAGGGVDLDAIDRIVSSPAIREVHVGRTVRDGGRVDGHVSADAVRAIRQRLERAESWPPPRDPSGRPPR